MTQLYFFLVIGVVESTFVQCNLLYVYLVVRDLDSRYGCIFSIHIHAVIIGTQLSGSE